LIYCCQTWVTGDAEGNGAWVGGNGAWAGGAKGIPVGMVIVATVEGITGDAEGNGALPGIAFIVDMSTSRQCFHRQLMQCIDFQL
jgi:hypothetical protein